MSKCIKDGNGKIRRVSDQLAGELVDAGEYAYCGKEEWKAQTRKKDPESV